jgi:CubicO group peptidase (beta-lactamase class C family)
MDVDPVAAGFDERRLERVVDHLRLRYLEPGLLPGCQVAVSRGDRPALFRSLGLADAARSRKVPDTAIWRIYSMTKPITAVAVLALYESGRLQLDDPVANFLPELKGIKVRERDPGGGERLVDPDRPVTVWDLLTHMAGFSFPGGRTRTMWTLASRSRGTGFAPPGLPPGSTLKTLVEELSGQPLEFQPGTRWLYTVATDVCARIVEAVTGQSFGAYLQATVFDPLGMADTGFHVPDDKLHRFGPSYRRDVGRTLAVLEDSERSAFRNEPTFQSGGGGLVSTTADYLRFSAVLANGGVSGGVRILGRKTVELIGSNHLPRGGDLRSVAMPEGYGTTDLEGMGFGLSVAVGLDSTRMRGVGSPGEMTWGGAASTTFWADPAERLNVVFMAQVFPSRADRIRRELKALVYAALSG